MGETVLSQIVCYKAQSFHNDTSDLLCEAASSDMNKWGGVWKYLDEQECVEARQLIVELVLLISAAWTFRFIDVALSFPFLLLVLVH